MTEANPLTNKQRAVMTDKVRKIVEEMYGKDYAATIPMLPRSEQQLVASELLITGLNESEVANALGAHRHTIDRWLRNETGEMQRLMRAAMGKDAIKSLPKMWANMKQIALGSRNDETRRKATLDVMRAGGSGIDVTAAPLTINVAGDASFGKMSVEDLDVRLEAIAKRVPEVREVLDAEFSVKKSEVKTDGPGPVENPGAGKDTPGKPDGGVPGPDPGTPAKVEGKPDRVLRADAPPGEVPRQQVEGEGIPRSEPERKD